MDGQDRILILGIGNVLWADEGFGVRAVEQMAERYAFAGRVSVMDGGTQGLALLPYVEDADVLLVFDAIDYGLPPGTLKVVRGDEVPAFLGAKKMSLHQTGFQEVIATAALTGRLPRDLILIGVQPVDLDDYGGGLRAAVADALAPALALALAELRRYGITPRERRGHPPPLCDPSISRRAYETGRPSAEAACRTADARFALRRGA